MLAPYANTSETTRAGVWSVIRACKPFRSFLLLVRDAFLAALAAPF